MILGELKPTINGEVNNILVIYDGMNLQVSKCFEYTKVRYWYCWCFTILPIAGHNCVINKLEEKNENKKNSAL